MCAHEELRRVVAWGGGGVSWRDEDEFEIHLRSRERISVMDYKKRKSEGPEPR